MEQSLHNYVKWESVYIYVNPPLNLSRPRMLNALATVANFLQDAQPHSYLLAIFSKSNILRMKSSHFKNDTFICFLNKMAQLGIHSVANL